MIRLRDSTNRLRVLAAAGGRPAVEYVDSQHSPIPVERQIYFGLAVTLVLGRMIRINAPQHIFQNYDAAGENK